MWVLLIVNVIFMLKITSWASNSEASNHDQQRMVGRVHVFIFNSNLVKFMYGVYLFIWWNLCYHFPFFCLFSFLLTTFLVLLTLQLFKELGSSILEILSVNLVSFVCIPVQVSYFVIHIENTFVFLYIW